jgi:signal transduction histidine kinase
MYAAQDLSSVRLPELVKSRTFQWGALAASAFALLILVLFGAVYFEIERYLTSRTDALITRQVQAAAGESLDHIVSEVQELLRNDPLGVQIAGFFSPERKYRNGNLAQLPGEFLADGVVRGFTVERLNGSGIQIQSIRLVGLALPTGIIVMGQHIDETDTVRGFMARALAIGLVFALFLAVAIGALLSVRAQRAVDDVNRSVEAIMQGDLKQRLPTRGGNDSFDKLALIVNAMLNRIEALVQEISNVGNDIAHDLRTPLTRVRLMLERGTRDATTLEHLQGVSDKAIASLDQTLSIITALLRIAEIEAGRRFHGFSMIVVADLVAEVADFYKPIAEDKQISLTMLSSGRAVVHADKDLLFEAIANLADNAIKFTPAGGKVQLDVWEEGHSCRIRVTDTGPGIRENEKEAILHRFYRSDRSRQAGGVGLGLSIVAAILNLHDFSITFTPGAGCVAEIVCPIATVPLDG